MTAAQYELVMGEKPDGDEYRLAAVAAPWTGGQSHEGRRPKEGKP